ncbi:uncharacterized protein LOC143612192 [Bidens hawaiensis]|uniref:uncharacterized protein LOC143612192 n=1 Tax=Bidens hawaiensis TaxID=980011 RepID=UPI004048EC13
MGDANPKNSGESSDNTKPKVLHPAYSVTNINTKIKTLDGNTITYSSWTKLFKLHAKAYKVLDHIEADSSPDPTSDEYAEWSELDSLVLQWIYNTITEKIFARILESNTTAWAAWVKLETIFLNNKHARAAALEQQSPISN